MMTITTYDRVALFPTRCSKCNRLFVFEGYDIYYKLVGVDWYDIKYIKCRECKLKEKIKNDGGL